MRKEKTIITLMLSVFLLLSFITSVHASSKEMLISDYVDEFCSDTKCDSVSVVVVNGDNVMFYGDANGLYQIGSMTKAFTGLGIQKLISDGVIEEDDNISKLIPGFTAYYDNKPCDITVRQLLTQTSGYTNKESDYPSAAEDMSLTEWVCTISGKELSFIPGYEYAYSNVNYNLLGAIIEQTSGKSYKEYMETEILKPLGLNNTYVQIPDDDERIIQGSRLGYRHNFAYIIPIAPGQIPAGYFYSNAADMARWIRILMGTADIPENYKVLIDTVNGNLRTTGDYYSGWELFENGTIGHSGGTPNYSSRIVFSDKDQVGVCVLTNMNVAASTDSLCNGLYTMSVGEEFGNIQTDIWTIFDILFISVTALGLLFIVISFIAKRRIVLIIIEYFLIIMIISVCVVMPLVFGSGLDKIIIIWAPYSFAGGLLMLTAVALAIAIKLRILKKNDNKKETSRRSATDRYNRISQMERGC